MTLEMARLEIIGIKTDLQPVLHTLHRLGCVHIDQVAEAPELSARPLAVDRETIRLQEELSYLMAQVSALLEVLGETPMERPSLPIDVCLPEARAGVDTLRPKVQERTARREKLRAEMASLPRYEATLRKLLPIIPVSAHEPGNVSIGVLVSRSHVGVLDKVGKNILDLTGGRAEIVSSDVDVSTRAMLIVFPQAFKDDIETLLGHEDVSRLRLPAELGTGPPDVVLTTLRQRLNAIPAEITQIDRELTGMAAQWSARLVSWREAMREELHINSVLSQFGETDLTFVLVGWVPAKKYEVVEGTLKEEIGDSVFIHRLPVTRTLMQQAPVIMQNPRAARPFESLVNLLALPKYGHIDPTPLMAFFLPFFFGMILGDVGYGTILLLLSLGLRRKYSKGVFRDILTVLAMGSAWAILFGILFGEAFGTLGEHFGMHPLWFDRASADHVFALLIMTVGIGAVHITLGLILGLWEAIKERSRSHLLERGGMLLGLIALFFVVGVLADFLPKSFLTPAISALIVGIGLLGASLGWLGVLMGPIEFIGLIGNVLSYLRIAAIGLASVYLAKAANDVAGMVGNLVVGVIIAVLIHALNLALGAFSPTIHSLRLHYVEFFRKFYTGGGRPYKPFRREEVSV